MNSRMASRLASWLVAIALISDAFVAPAGIATAATAPGTQITNNATATYKDAALNVYNTTSNTVTTVVQNAPTLTLGAAAGANYSPGQVVTDTFTITNTGNASGTFQINGNNTINGSGNFSSAADATLGGSDSGSAALGSGPLASGCGGSGASTYVINGTINCPTLALANTYLSAHAVAAGSGVDTVSVYYAMNAGSTTPGTVSSSLYANISYVAAGTAPAEVSAVTAIATETNNIVADANINQYKSSIQCAATPCTGNPPMTTYDAAGDLLYTVSATNGGAKAAQDLTSVKDLMGSSWSSINGGLNAGGVLLSDKVPQFASAPLALSNATGGNWQVSVTLNATYGFATGAKAYLVYSTSSTAATWAVGGAGGATSGTTIMTIPTSAGSVYYIGVVIVNGTCTTSGFELCSYTTNATTNGNTNVSSYPAVQYSYTIAAPTGPGSANIGVVTNVGDAMWGDNQPTEHVLGPDINGGVSISDTSCAGTCLNVPSEGINYISVTVITGASNQTANQALAAFATLTGPYDLGETGACSGLPGTTNCHGADGTGSYDGSVASTNADDFTAASFDSADNIVNNGTVDGTPVTPTSTSGGSTLCIEHTLFNSGNKTDAYNIAVGAQPTGYALPTTSGGTASTGWTFGVYSDSACSLSLGGSTQGSTTTATAVGLASGANLQYYIKYVVPSGLKYFTRFDTTITATSNGTGNPANTTHDELYSGFIAFTKTILASSTTNCPTAFAALAGNSATITCPGGTLLYSLDYRNLVMGTSSTNASFAQCITPAGSLVMTDDGTQATLSSSTTPNWATFTTGLQVAPVDSTSNSVARTTNGFTYSSAIPAVTYVSSFSANATAFKDQVGGSSFQLAPMGYFSVPGNPTLPVAAGTAIDWQGTITFSLTVK
jgi:hypothetical protein